MYFNEKKSDTNIDKDFKEKKNIFLSILSWLNKFKIFIFIAIGLVIAIFMVFMFMNREVTNYLYLDGNEEVTIYQGSDYIESGYKAYNSKNEDLTSGVIVQSTLNVNQIGTYEITYKLRDIVRVRKVNVIEKPREYTYIYLNTVNNNVNVYVKLGENYVEPGYQVFSSSKDITKDKVTISGNVDTSKKGSYTLVYSLVDSYNVTISASRVVTVMDLDISLSLSNENYTNDSVNINALVYDDFFDYLVLPNYDIVKEKSYSYKVTENGKYTFTAYSTMGMIKESTIEVKNIDKNGPTGSCVIDQGVSNSTITISANDDIGISKYVYNNKEYNNNIITVNGAINSANITIYDKASNRKDISCTVTPKVYINNISKDGVIITVNAKKVNSNIRGYYFSYNSTRPNKNTGGYLETSNSSVSVVRLPGTTYVWVEDTAGRISSYKTVTISNDALLMTKNSKYKILQNKRLETYLKEQGWSLTELNKLINRSARAAGLYTKTAAATSAVALQTVLAQKYSIRLPYWWGGKSWSFGADPEWGEYRYKINDNTGREYFYDGLDCSGFTTWAYVNAGYDIGSVTNKYGVYFDAWWKKRIDFDKGEIGDFLVYNDDRNNRHVKLIVGKTSTGYITAESSGGNEGMIINTHEFNKAGKYKVEKAEILMEEYSKFSKSQYPTGF